MHRVLLPGVALQTFTIFQKSFPRALGPNWK
jgi:hypothetical protein